MSFSPMDTTSEAEATLTDEKLERVFREIEEASERRAREEEEREKDSEPSPLDPVLQALSNTTSLAELKKQRRRQSISVSRVGSHADVPAEFRGPGSPVPWNATPLYRTKTQTSTTSTLSSSSSYISDHGNANGAGGFHARHYQEENHTTQKETIAGRRNTLTKAMSTAFSRTLTRMRSRGGINEVENEVVIGVAVHEARVETTVEADATTEEVGRVTESTSAEPGSGAGAGAGPAVASLTRVATLTHIGSSTDANSDVAPSRRVSINATVGPKTQTSALAEAGGRRSRSGSVGKLREILPLRSQASSNSNSTSASEAKEKEKEGKEKDAKEKEGKEKKDKKEKEMKEKEMKQREVAVQDSSRFSTSGTGISTMASSSGTISGESNGIDGTGNNLSKEKYPEKNGNGKASKRLSSFAKVLAQRLTRKGSVEGSDCEKKDKDKEKDRSKDKDNSKKLKSRSARVSYISNSASPLSPTVSSFPQPQQLPPSEILDQPILKSPHLAAPASIPSLKELARVQRTEGGPGSGGGLGALPPSPQRSPSAAEVPLPASPAGTTTHPLSPRSPASTSSLPMSIAVTSSDGHGRRSTKEGDRNGIGIGGEDVEQEPSMVPLPASPTCETGSFDVHVLDSQGQSRICTCGKRERLPPSALPDSDFGPVSREPSEHSHSGENTPLKGTSPLSSLIRTESRVNFGFAIGVEGMQEREREREGEGEDNRKNEETEVEARRHEPQLVQRERERETETEKAEGAALGEDEKEKVVSEPDAQGTSTS